MVGKISQAQVAYRGGPAGGLIRAGEDESAPRIRFEAGELLGLTIGEALGRTVAFNTMATEAGEVATRVRPARILTDGNSNSKESR